MARETASCPFTRYAPSQKITSPPSFAILSFSSWREMFEPCVTRREWNASTATCHYASVGLVRVDELGGDAVADEDRLGVAQPGGEQ